MAKITFKGLDDYIRAIERLGTDTEIMIERSSLMMSLVIKEALRPETQTAVKAPIAIKPAWPSESSPEKPTTRLSDRPNTM